MQEEEPDAALDDADVSMDSGDNSGTDDSLGTGAEAGARPAGKKSTSNVAGGAIFREVVMAKVREMKEQEQALKVEKEAHEKEARRRSFQG